MPKKMVSSQISQAIQNASPLHVINSMRICLPTMHVPSCWLSKSPYDPDIVGTLGNLLSPPYPNELKDYLGASVVLHNQDGWRFFSLAMHDLLIGDGPNAVFMAYYAQLRAMMSFFAAKGIGIFNLHHFWVDNLANWSCIKEPTHKVIPALIEAWASEPANSLDLLRTFKVENINFPTWISSADVHLGNPPSPEVATDWLKTWSLDLQILSKDHELRNETSYRPQRIFSVSPTYNFEQSFQLCSNAWKACEPIGDEHFPDLDKYLLRKVLMFVYTYRTAKQATGSGFEKYISDAMVDLGLSPTCDLFNFLSNKSEINDHPLLTEANRNATEDHARINPIPMIARAFLLLRLSSSLVEDFLQQCGAKKGDIQFWWKNFGNDFGLWPVDSPPDPLSDLWVDVEESLLNLQNVIQKKAGSVGLNTILRDYSLEIVQIGQFSRAGLWAIGL